MTKFEQECIAADCVECFAVVNKACKYTSFLATDIFFDDGVQCQDVIVALSSFAEAKLVREVGAHYFSEVKQPFEKDT